MTDAEFVRSCCQNELETDEIEPDSVESSLTPPRDEPQHQAESSVPDDLDISERINT